MNKETKIIFILRIIILVLLISFFIIFNRTGKTNCQACSFEIKGEEYNAEGFFNMYADKCLVKQSSLKESFNLSLRD